MPNRQDENRIKQTLNGNFLALLQRMKIWQLVLFSIGLSVLLSELLVVVIALSLKGEVPPDYLLTGFITSLFVATLIVVMLGYFLNTLKERETLFHAVFDNAAVGIAQVGLTGQFLQINQEFCRIIGYSKEEILSSLFTFHRITYPDDLGTDIENINQLLGGKNNRYSLEKRYIHKNGEIVWVSLSVQIVKNNTGEPLFFISAVHDISARKKVEEQLSKSEQQFSQLVEKIPLPIGLADYTGELLYINARFIRTFGYTLDEIPCITDWYLKAYPDSAYRQEVITRWTCAIEKAVKYNTDIETDEYYVTCKNGEVRVMLIAGIFLENSLLATFIDITERKRMEVELRKSAEMLKEAQEIVHLGHWRLDIPANTLYWSDEIYRIFGVQPQEFFPTRETFLNYAHPDDRDFVNESYINHLNNKSDYAIEHRLLLQDGRIKHVYEKCKTEFNQDGQALCSLGGVLDITERKLTEQVLQEKTEALQRSNNDLEQFAYSVSHDMRQPLRSVSGHLQLLAWSLKGKIDEEEQINLNFALEGAKRMDAMILSLLDYSRVGRKTETKSWIDSRIIVNDALEFLYPAIEEAKVEVKISGEWDEVFASHDELTRLFMNLIGNAIKYREAYHPPLVEIDSIVTDKHWKVSVRDYGIGINPQQTERLFKFFSRLQSRTRFEGTGMGLALCRRIVEHHGGKIWVESEGEGRGSCFVFELPRTKDLK